MKYSYNWIQSHIVEKLPSVEELKQVIIFHAFEVEGVEEYKDDFIFDINVLPDRAGDCFSHYGMAREIAGLLKLNLKKIEYTTLATPDLTLPIEIQSTVCKRYIAVAMDTVNVAPSPAWLVERLASVGQKSINNVVDITNFLMLDSGQPVHAFDITKVDGGIVVRAAKEGEKIITLSNEEKVLRPENIVIADYLGALAIAGVKGGKSAEVTNDTKSIIIEVANFDATSVRKTSRGLALITDASKRFENNLSSIICHNAAMQAITLMSEIAGASVVGMKDIYPAVQETRTLSFTVHDIARLLGDFITAKQITEVLNAYHYEYTVAGDIFTLTIPAWRADITGAHDLVEEIGRVIGYDVVQAKPLPFVPTKEINDTDKKIMAVKYELASKGFREVMTYTFRPKGEVNIAYGAKGKSALRSSLSEGLKESFDLNKLNAPFLGLDTIKIFEIGTVFFADREEIHVATMDNGTLQELSLDQFITEKNISLDTNAVELHLEKTPAPFVMWSLYPFIVRDIAVWLQQPVDKSRFVEILSTFAKEFCAQDPHQIDEFTKEGRTSVAFRLIFQGENRTLTDIEVNAWMEQLFERIKLEKSFEIR